MGLPLDDPLVVVAGRSRISPLSNLSYSYGERIFLAGDDVLEVFGRLVDGSKRFPIAWIGVQIETRKNDQIRVSAGLAQAGEPFWTDRILTNGPLSQFDLPASEEPAVRAFFDELARRAGRS
jgi:hypothetical protein